MSHLPLLVWSGLGSHSLSLFPTVLEGYVCVHVWAHVYMHCVCMYGYMCVHICVCMCVCPWAASGKEITLFEHLLHAR